jgi:hypothetical protein
MHQHLVSAEELAEALNKLSLSNPMWGEGGFRVGGRWLEIDPDESDELAAWMLKCDIETARRRNDAEARWFVAGGVGVVYVDGQGWRPVPPEWALARQPSESEADEAGEGDGVPIAEGAPVPDDVPV